MDAKETLENLRVGDIQTNILDAIREVLAEVERLKDQVCRLGVQKASLQSLKDAAVVENDILHGRIEAALALHTQPNEPSDPDRCPVCRWVWPCPTYLTLTGGKEK